MNNRILKIVVTGANGMVGNAVQRVSQNMNKVIALLDEETKNKIEKNRTIFKFIFLDRKQLDLTDRERVFSAIRVYKPDAVLHLAAKVGGLFANQNDNAGFYFQNLHMSENLLAACYKEGVSHTFTFLSTCIYPQNPELLPYRETNLHAGEPHPSNYGYAFAKRQHEVMARLYNSLGSNNVCLIPNNLYGPNDNFDLNKAHVIPAIISKTYNAIVSGQQLVLPGSGLAQREFTYVDDIVCQSLAYMLYYLNTIEVVENGKTNKPKIINIGNNEEVKILDVLTLIYKAFSANNINPTFDLNQVFSQSKFSQEYDGIFRKPSSLELLHSILPKTKETTSLNEGLQETVSWFLKEKAR